MDEKLCIECVHYEHCQSLIYTINETTKACDFSPSKFKQNENIVKNTKEANGAIRVCKAVHTFCLQEGLKSYSTDEQRKVYQHVIIFLNRKFGYLR